MTTRVIEKLIKVSIWIDNQLTHEIELEETKEEFLERLIAMGLDEWVELSNDYKFISVRADCITSIQVDVIVRGGYEFKT